MYMIKHVMLFILTLLISSPLWAATTCDKQGVWLQVLGSGGPELNDKRASSGYLIWHDGKARVLVDLGAGSLLRFEQAGAAITDLDVILLSHLHVDHSNDLPALIKASFFTNRQRDLPVYGPTGNWLMPSLTNFVQDLFAAKGAYKYLSDYLNGKESYRLLPHDVSVTDKSEQVVLSDARYELTAVPVHHGPIPALAWRVKIAGKRIIFSGDMNNDNNTLAALAKQADLLVAHHAIPEAASGVVARNLHMPPSVIGKIAAQAQVKQLLLSHRMNRTLGKEAESTKQIRRAYQGPLAFVDDLQCVKP